MKKTLVIAGCILLHLASLTAKEDPYFAIAKNLDIFNAVVKELQLHYVDTIPINKIVTSGINGMLETLDPYTNYIPFENTKDFKLITTGEYGGIGSVISTNGDQVFVSEIYEGMPAHKAGIQPGDILLEIDNKSTKGKTTTEVSSQLRGIPGTELTVKVQRAGQKRPLLFNITREIIYLNPVVYAGIVADSTAYIRLTNFTDNCTSEIKQALTGLQKEGMKSLILDLRANPGGILNEAIQTTNLFVPKGETIVTTRGKGGKLDRVYKTATAAQYPHLPLIILVDNGSASASEIVAGAMQDMDRAVIMGERTYGKGLVQGTFPVSYDGQIKVTIAKYYIPSGRCIQAIRYTTKDGEVSEQIPDSLTSEFSTRNGRKVRDGRGVTPDLTVRPDTGMAITYDLLSDNLLFKYAGEYYREHDRIASVDSFELTDRDFEQFKQFVKDQGFEYTTDTDYGLNKLIDIAKEDKLYEPNKAAFEALQAALAHDLSQDLDEAKKEIMEFLSAEIIKRYYFQKGEIQWLLKTDPVVAKAIDLLHHPEEMNRLLSGNK
ncbi:MAG: S41 family peptidase [Paludibacteraceae bacterium]|nr:S41 family peptidase [Paludibacteraceae bacterium]